MASNDKAQEAALVGQQRVLYQPPVYQTVAYPGVHDAGQPAIDPQFDRRMPPGYGTAELGTGNYDSNAPLLRPRRKDPCMGCCSGRMQKVWIALGSCCCCFWLMVAIIGAVVAARCAGGVEDVEEYVFDATLVKTLSIKYTDILAESVSLTTNLNSVNITAKITNMAKTHDGLSRVTSGAVLDGNIISGHVEGDFSWWECPRAKQEWFFPAGILDVAVTMAAETVAGDVVVNLDGTTLSALSVSIKNSKVTVQGTTVTGELGVVTTNSDIALSDVTVGALSASTTNSEIVASNVFVAADSASVDLRTTNDEIHVTRLGTTATGGLIRISTTNDDVDVQVDAGSASATECQFFGTYELATTNGDTSLQCTTCTNSESPGGPRARGTVRGGGALALVVESTNSDVSVEFRDSCA